MSANFRKSQFRIPDWDYRKDGAYFITICTKNRIHFFGEINQRKMILSEIGKIAEECWLKIEGHFPNVHLREFVVMPDHMHGIIVIDKSLSSVKVPLLKENRFQQIGKHSISTIVGSFKSAVSKKSREINPVFAWHPRFNDRVIRSSMEFERIENYISKNVENYHS
jgi:REP element-mobilizing transposase RayT